MFLCVNFDTVFLSFHFAIPIVVCEVCTPIEM